MIRKLLHRLDYFLRPSPAPGSGGGGSQITDALDELDRRLSELQREVQSQHGQDEYGRPLWIR